MRKIEQEMIKAVLHKKSKSFGNTTVSTTNDKTLILLHGNKIAEINWPEMKIDVRDCGWKTPTTKSRLNALLDKFTDSRIFQKKGQWFIRKNQGDAQNWYNGRLLDISFNNCNYLYAELRGIS